MPTYQKSPGKTSHEKVPTAWQRWWQQSPARSWQKAWQRKHDRQSTSTTSSKSVSLWPAWLLLIVRILTWPLRNPIARIVVILLVVISVGSFIYVARDLPSPRNLTSKENFAVSTQIFDRNGELLYEIFGDENRIPVQLADLPPHVAQATIAIEDKNFYHHFGFDIVGIMRALRTNLSSGATTGGSTITQQLVKNALLTNEKSIQRKVKEGILSLMTEAIYSKEEILEMYLNYISYGGTAVGIEAASRQYFDKSAQDLTLAETALLVGLPQAPSRYSPFASDATAAKNRQAAVLNRMVEDGYITQAEAEEAKAETLHFALNTNDIQAPHFVFFVRDLLYEEYGVETVERGGLRVRTTLDLNLQRTAQASLSAEITSLERYNVGNGAALVTKPNTGEILAMVGSKNYFDVEGDGQVNVTLRPRQPGSSIKPLMYATAFQLKLLNPGTVILDIPTCFNVINQRPYCPKNYDGSFKGQVDIRGALGNSLNIPAVKSLKLIGLENFINQARRMGITSWVDPSRYGLSLTLGGGEIKMIDMAQAFGVLANEGVKVPLTPILEITDYQGNIIAETDIDQRLEDLSLMNTYDDELRSGELERVMDRAPAYLTSHIMQDNNARTAAFGPRSELVIPNQVVSAKTGTTNDLKDNWTVGFTPEFLVITWVGNNDATPMNPRLVSGITGAAPIFNDIMSFILQGREPVWQEKPSDVLSGMICPTGMPPLAGESCPIAGPELYWRESQPSATVIRTEDVWIDPATGLPPQPGQQIDGLVLENRTIVEDPLTSQYCADCNRPANEDGAIIYERYTISETSTSTEQVTQ